MGCSGAETAAARNTELELGFTNSSSFVFSGKHRPKGQKNGSVQFGQLLRWKI
jgi:hypothetical protein